MASAQQKPKATSADKRNSDRRNGKAFGKATKQKCTGRTILGYKREIVVARAKAADPDLFRLDPDYALKKYVEGRKAARVTTRREAAAQRANQRRTADNSASTGRPGSARVNGGN